MNKENTNIWYSDDKPGVVRRILVLYQSGGFHDVDDSSVLLQPPDIVLGYYTH